jgi:hypothetical protein
MKLGKKLTNAIEAADFSIYQEDENCYRFGKYSSEGQDFSFCIDTEGDMSSFMYNILNYYNDFDVSEEAYIWLDDTGHGRNGAPYDMKDVYEDMEECHGFIYELYKIVREFC